MLRWFVRRHARHDFQDLQCYFFPIRIQICLGVPRQVLELLCADGPWLTPAGDLSKIHVVQLPDARDVVFFRQRPRLCRRGDLILLAANHVLQQADNASEDPWVLPDRAALERRLGVTDTSFVITFHNHLAFT